MNKNWIILFLVTMFIIEYNNGFKKEIFIDGDFNITYPTTVIKLKGKARGHKKYIDMRRVKQIYEYEIEGAK